jgi:hypothetical protein
MEQNQLKLISLRDAAKMAPYSQEYLGLLVRKGKLFGEKIGGRLYTTEEALKNYLQKTAEASYEHQQRLNVEIPAEEIKKAGINLKWALALLGVTVLLILVGVVIFFKIQDDRRTEMLRNKYFIQEDNSGNVKIFTDYPEQVKSVKVEKKNW